MAVVSTEELFPGRKGSDGIERKLRYTRIYEVITDDPDDDANIAGIGDGSIPRNGDPHPNNAFAIMVSITADNSDATPFHWLVVCEYDTDLPHSQSRESGGFDTSGNSQAGGQGSSSSTPGNPLARDDNPLDRPPTFSSTWEQTTEIITHGIESGREPTLDAIGWSYGNQIVNGVGDPFDPPPTREVAYPIITISKNYPIGDPILTLGSQNQWQNAVNLLDWRGFERGTLRIVGMDFTFATENGISFARMTFRMRGNADGFDLTLTNQGFRYIPDPAGLATRVDIDTVVGSGRARDKPTPLHDEGIMDPGDNLQYLTWQIYPELDFDDLGL